MFLPDPTNTCEMSTRPTSMGRVQVNPQTPSQQPSSGHLRTDPVGTFCWTSFLSLTTYSRTRNLLWVPG